MDLEFFWLGVFLEASGVLLASGSCSRLTSVPEELPSCQVCLDGGQRSFPLYNQSCDWLLVWTQSCDWLWAWTQSCDWLLGLNTADLMFWSDGKAPVLSENQMVTFHHRLQFPWCNSTSIDDNNHNKCNIVLHRLLYIQTYTLKEQWMCMSSLCIYHQVTFRCLNESKLMRSKQTRLIVTVQHLINLIQLQPAQLNLNESCQT